ncbi:choice-of-anchor A domain-containing protein [Cellulosimicrobium cellulans]|uniref:DUF5979 domain-containing protein n=1 Tax=Cellulosimicrobium cellulans TaxID=1710 RepID=UPI00195DFB51|nr:DUF5979 domain-containing protein [Cellulosimicrobium cellulans]MBM7821618.1 choice-of-anchor A domain-containing protein [Cellulosimicrobium cellulans]
MSRGTRPRTFDPLRRAVAAVTAATLALAGAVVLVTGPQAAPSFAAVGQCPDPGQFPGIGNLPPVFTDNNVAVYAGGNFLATGSASEAEGVLVVGGDATFNRTLSGSSFNVGTVGAGSQIAPDPGTVMLHVGGTLDVVAPTNVIVGAGYSGQGGGDVQVGAAKTGAGTVDMNGGELRPGLGAENALAPFGDFGDQVSQASTAFAGLTGTPVAVAGNSATFDGSTSSALHVFTVDAAVLNGVNELNFNGFTDGAPIVINVVGGPVDFQPNYFAANNVRFDDFASPDFGNWASRIMWNFVDADAVQLGPAGASQFMGSVMAPTADVQLYNHMNGRVYVGGDLTFGGEGSQSGLEIHNYPWIGPGPFNCVPTSSFVVQKTVTGAAAADVPAGTVFTVHYSYVTPEPDSETGEGDLEVPLNGNLVAGPDLPVGTVVTVSEPTLPSVPGVSWGSPVFRVNGDVVSDPTSFTVVDGSMMTVSVVNTANAGGPVGGFSVQKAALQGNAAGAVDPATEYQVEWTATLPEGTTYDGDLSGTLTVLADGAVVDGPQDLPVGTTVTFAEVTPDPVDGVVWATPVVEPSTVTVGDGQNTLVTVTNTATSQVGGFTVVKIVDGNATGLVPGDTAFTVTWTADIPDGVVYGGETTGQAVILADGTPYAGPVDLPVGTVVTFTEVAPPVIDGVVWGTPSISPAELTVGQGQPAIVQVTNTASTVNGGFTVHKELLGNASGAVPGDTAFLVDWAATLPTGVTYGGPLAGTVTVLADGTVVDGPQDLPVGTVVTFAEQTPFPEVDGVQWGDPIISPESLVVSENGGQPAAVTVTNVATSVDGGFTLQKALAGNASGAVPDDTEFLVDWSAVLPTGVTYDGALSGTLTVLADGTVVDGPQNLPVGTVVTLTEQTPLPVVSNVVWGDPSFDPGAQVTITENGGEAVGITVTNTATSTVGGFAVAKDVVGDAAGLVPGSTPFSVTWVATLPAGVTYDGSLTGTLTVLADGTVVDGPQDLPVGTTVTFSESTFPTIPNVVWGDPSFDPATLTVTETGDTPALVTVTNTASSVVGGFTLQKDVQGNAAGIVPDITTFTVAWTAVLPPDVAYDGPLTGTLTVRADGTVVDGPADLPVGTVVTFAEQTPLPEVGDVVWGPPSFTPAQLTVTENDGEPVAVTVTNTANSVVGSFGVAKALAGNAQGIVPDDTAFLVDWSADIPDGVDYDGDTSGTLTVLADGTVVDGPTDLPVGTVVTLSEQTPLPEVDGVVWGTPSYDPGTTVTITENAGAPVVVTLTNTATTVDGGFSVAKALTGNAAGLVPGDTAFLVDWSAVLPDGVTYAGPLTGTVTVLASGAVVAGPQDLPVGTTVTFTERTPLPSVDGVVWGVPSFAPASTLVVVENGGDPVTVTVTNMATTVNGGFTVAKAVTGNAAGLVPDDTEFVVGWSAALPEGVTYPGPLTGTLTVLADGTVVDGPADLPVGTVVTFTEQTPLPDVPDVVWGTPAFAPGAEVTIVEGATGVELTVTNTATSVVGGFTLAKDVQGDAAGIVPDGTEFLVDWTAVLPDGVTYDGDLSGTLTVLADGTVVDGPADLPVGTVVTFAEQTPPPEVPNVVWGTPTYAPGTELTITENGGAPVAVTVTNTATSVVGGFTVHKALAGNAAGAVPSGTEFLVDWTAVLPDGVTYDGDLSGTLTVLADGTVVDGPADLPVGTVVTFAEQTPLPEVPNVVWGTPAYTPGAQVTIVEGATGVELAVTNTATSVVGGFTLQKDVTGNAAGLVPGDTAFSVTWVATLPAGVTYDGFLTGTLTILADGTVVDGPQDLPVGTTVTFTEATPPAVDGVTWGAVSVDPAALTVAENGGAPSAVTVTNTANAVTGSFGVAKALAGNAAGVVPDDTAFLVDWTATIPAGVDYDGDTSGTLSVLADGTVADGPADLPVGTVVTFAEQTPLPEIADVVWGTPELSPESVTIAEGDEPVVVTVTNTATSVVGGFSLAKDVQGDAAGIVPDGTEFLVDWTATLPAGVTYDGDLSGTLTVLADGTVVDGPQDLPVGTVVTFAEQTPLPDVPDVVWGTPSFAPGTELTVTENDGQPVAVTVTNTATSIVGGFAVQKALAGDAAGVVPGGTEFLVDWTAVLPEGVTYDGDLSGTLTVLADGTVVDGPQDLPVGTVVTFAEQTPLPEVPNVVWGDPVVSPESVTITETGETPTLVTVTNTATSVVGGFAVAKALAGNAAGVVPDGTEFLVDWTATLPDGVTYDGDLSGTLTVLADGTVVDGPQDLPVGAVVTFAEQTPLPDVPDVVWGTPEIAPESVTITETGDTPTEVTVTNTATSVVGGFTLQKSVIGDAAGIVPDGTEFSVTWVATLPPDVTYDGFLTGTLTVLADGTVVDGPQDLPVGTTVTFTEATPPAVPGVTWGAVSVDPAQLTVTENDGEPVAVTVTNTANAVTGSFGVAKALAGNAAGVVPDDTAFLVDWSATLPDGVTYPGPLTGTLTVLADGTVTDGPADLPVGTVVTFAEQTPLPDVPDVVWGTPELSPESVTIAEGDEPVVVTVTNTATSVVGGFSVTKALAGNAAGIVPDGTEFLVDWTATLPAGVTYDGDLSGTLTVLADGTVVDGPADLPVGTVVTFAEQTPPDVADVVWGDPVFSPESVTITETGDAPTEVTVTNTATSVVGGFSLQKALTGDSAGVVPSDTAFLVDWSAVVPEGVTYDGDVSGTLTVLADGTVVDGPQDLPVGTVVTFAEQTPLPEVPGVAWGEPSLDPEGALTITENDGEPAAVTVVNTADTVFGTFTVAKALTGAAAGAVPEDTAFTVTWSATLPDGVTFDGPTSGTLTVLADGAVVDGLALPYGTAVTLAEPTFPDVPGIAWGTPTFDPATVVVGDADAPVAVTVTNTAVARAGGFTVHKEVGGDATSLVPADTAFQVDWTAVLPAGVEYDGAMEGTLTVLADGTVVAGPQDLPVGTEVTFTERTPLPEVRGVLWGEPMFAVDGAAVDPATLTVVADTAVAVTLTNTANDAHLVGGFAVHKVVTGNAAGRVPDDTTFTVTWTADVPGGTLDDGPTSGRLTVRADGTVVTGPADLPEGTVVTLGEVDLPSIDGVRWGTPAFTVDGERTAELTVAVGELADVTLTNTASTTGGLAVTGATTGGLVGLGALLVLGGAALLAVTRRRRTA